MREPGGQGTAPAETAGPDTETSSDRRRWWRRASVLVALLVSSLVVVLLTWPQIFGAQRAFGVAQLIAFRAPLAIGWGLLTVAVAVVAVLLARRNDRRKPLLALGLVVVLAAGALGNGAVLLSRGWDTGEPLPAGDLVVLAWNTQGGATSPDEIARVAAEVRADVVSLPETDEDAAGDVVRLLAARGIAMTAHTARADGDYDWIPTSVLIADGLGEYALDREAGSTPGLPSGVWKRVDGDDDAPVIVAAHPLPPLPSTMDAWEAGLEWVGGACSTSGPHVVVAGDFNATDDHLAGLGAAGHLIGLCDDAAQEAGGAASGTWPADVPSWVSSPIDHVLHGSGWTARSVRVLDGDPDGTDHRPIVAVLDRR